MSAPIIAYRPKSLFIDSKEHLIAKLQVDYNTMKSWFYLDELLTIELEDGTDGVIGLVTIDGANESLHNITTRGGSGRIGNMRMLNDGGINTRGDAQIIEIKHTYKNFIAFKVSGKAAYYFDSAQIGLDLRESSESWGEANRKVIETDISKNTSITPQFTVIRPTLGDFETGIVRAFNLNDEGEYHSDSESITVGDESIKVVSSPYHPISGGTCGADVENKIVLMTDADYLFLQTFTSTINTNTGVYIYKGAPLSNPLDENGDFILESEGYYRGLDGVYNNMFYVSTNGEVLRRDVCIPPLPHLGFLNVFPGKSTPTNPAEYSILTYSVDEEVSVAYTITGYVQEFNGLIPVGTSEYFSLTVSASSSTVVWNTIPDMIKYYSGKFNIISTTITPTGLGTFTTTNES